MIKRLEKKECLVPECLKQLDKEKFFVIANFLPKRDIALLNDLFGDINSVFKKDKINATTTDLRFLDVLIKDKISSLADKIDFEVSQNLYTYTEKEKRTALTVLLKKIDYDNEEDVKELELSLFKNRFNDMQKNQYPTIFELFSFCPRTDIFACIGKLNDEDRNLLKKYSKDDFSGKFVLGLYNEELVLILIKLYSVILKEILNNKNQININKQNVDNKSQNNDKKQKQTRKKRTYLRQYFEEYCDEIFYDALEILTEKEKEILKMCYGENYQERFENKKIDTKIINYLGQVLRKLTIKMEELSNNKPEINKNDNEQQNIEESNHEQQNIEESNDTITEAEQTMDDPINNLVDDQNDYLKIYNLFQEILFDDVIKEFDSTDFMILLIKYKHGPHSNDEISKFLNLNINNVNGVINKYVRRLKEKSLELVNEALDKFVDEEQKDIMYTKK